MPALARARARAEPSAPHNGMRHPRRADDPTPAGLRQNVAAFLVARGPWWWLGQDWMGPTLATWSSLYDELDVGVPVSECSETSPGVFGRNYSNGFAQLDCSGSEWAATLAF